MKQIYFTLLLLLSCSCAFAQKDFREGYIILQGDTVRGLVDYRGDKRSAQLVTYKATQNGAQHKYTPADIAGYGFLQEQKVFETKELPAIDSVQQPLFLNVLVKGQASIYFYLDAMQREHYYLLMQGQPLTKLNVKEYTERHDNGKLYKVVRKDYQNLLVHAFADCPDITQQQIEDLKLSKETLVDITRKYNACMGGSVFVGKSTKTSVTYGIALLYTATALRFSGDSYLDGTTFKEKSSGLGGGVAVNVSPSSFNEKLSLQLELLYDPGKFAMQFSGPKDYTGRSDTYETNFDLIYLKLPVQVRYVYPRGKLRPFLNLGGLAGYALRHNHSTTTTRTFAGIDRITTLPAIGNNGFKQLMVGVTGGAGLSYDLYGKPVFLEVRFEKTNGISDLISLASKMETFYIFLRYTL